MTETATLEMIDTAPEPEISPDYTLTVNGREVIVHHCAVASYAIACVDSRADMVVEVLYDFERVVVRPLSRGVETDVAGRQVCFSTDGPGQLSVEFDDNIERPLLLFLLPPETDRPSPSDPSVIYFAAGEPHTPGLIEVESGQTVYIEEGARVYGAILAQDVEHVRVCGRGILDGSCWSHDRGRKRPRLCCMAHCRDVRVEGVTFVDSPSWTMPLYGCEDACISNANIITIVGTGDGIDIVGSKNVTVEGCFARTNDDCVAIKASGYRFLQGGADVERVRVQNSVFWNAHCGNALEIGYETRTERIHDIVFRNCDIIRSEYEGWESGAAMSIHNTDRAEVYDVHFEDIRCEDIRQKLIDLKISISRYSKDEQRGQVHDITFKDISVGGERFPVSIIRGFGQEHIIRNVTFENLMIHGQHIRDEFEARMVVEIARGISFR